MPPWAKKPKRDRLQRDHRWLSQYIAYDSWPAVMAGLPFISVDWLPEAGLRFSTIGPDMRPFVVDCWPQNETDVVYALAHLIREGSWNWTVMEGEEAY